jgi:hypothetical protein
METLDKVAWAILAISIIYFGGHIIHAIIR